MARHWLDRVEEYERTDSWSEELTDDTAWLATYIATIDSLDFAAAEQMRLQHSSPMMFQELWGLALHAQVRHLVLTNRHEHARDLCEEVAARGLPAQGADGWVATMLAEAQAHCFRFSALTKACKEIDTPASALAHRLHLLITGQFDELAERTAESTHHDGRAALALRLLRAQGVLHCDRTEEGITLLLAALRDVFSRGTLGVLRYLGDEALSNLTDHDLGARAAAVLAETDLDRPKVHLLTTPLTPAQLRVVRMLRDGSTRQQAADELGISVDTVKSHLTSAYRKLGARSRDEAAVRLSELGL